MALVNLGPDPVSTVGELPLVGSIAPAFVLSANDLTDVKLSDFKGKNVILNIFPSVDTSICSASVREFNKRAASLPNTAVLCVSKDLPMALKRFCGSEGIENVQTLSDFRNRGFGKDYGVELVTGAFAALFARAIVIADADGKVKYTELAKQIGEHIDYEAAMKAIS